MAKRFYVTTPLYYVNDRLHLGHAYATVGADVLARYRRLRGEPVFFLTGTDEHGQKIAEAAAGAGQTPQAWADTVSAEDRALWERLDITHDRFIRTTDPDHVAVVQAAFSKLLERGDIVKGEYRGPYCVSDETFVPEAQLVDGKNCPDCGRPATIVSEPTYLFRLSAYQEKLLAQYEAHPEFIRPASRLAEVVNFVKGGLRDQSVSRLASKVPWGVPVPGDPDHTVYVWFDALLNYLTAAGYPDEKKLSKTWPADVHVVGKEIVRFHAVIWPAMLMGLGLPLPRVVFGHGWWTVEGEKMSKSRGNIVDPHAIVDEFGSDAFRYVVLREMPFGHDGDFSRARFLERYEVDLADGLGNLASRLLRLVTQHAGGSWEDLARGKAADGEAEKSLTAARAALPGRVEAAFEPDRLAFHEALGAIWEAVSLGNQYIQHARPWETIKTDRPAAFRTLLHVGLLLRDVTALVWPVLPRSMTALRASMGLPLIDQQQGGEGLRAAGSPGWSDHHAGARAAMPAPLFPKMRQAGEPRPKGRATGDDVARASARDSK